MDDVVSHLTLACTTWHAFRSCLKLAILRQSGPMSDSSCSRICGKCPSTALSPSICCSSCSRRATEFAYARSLSLQTWPDMVAQGTLLRCIRGGDRYSAELRSCAASAVVSGSISAACHPVYPREENKSLESAALRPSFEEAVKEILQPPEPKVIGSSPIGNAFPSDNLGRPRRVRHSIAYPLQTLQGPEARQRCGTESDAG